MFLRKIVICWNYWLELEGFVFFLFLKKGVYEVKKIVSDVLVF